MNTVFFFSFFSEKYFKMSVRKVYSPTPNICSPLANMYSPVQFIYSPGANKDFHKKISKRCHDIHFFSWGLAKDNKVYGKAGTALREYDFS